MGLRFDLLPIFWRLLSRSNEHRDRPRRHRASQAAEPVGPDGIIEVTLEADLRSVRRGGGVASSHQTSEKRVFEG